MDIKLDLQEIIKGHKWEDDNFTTHLLEEAYIKGAIESIKLFAVWREGKQHINDMRTLEEAVEIIKEMTK